MSAGAVATAYVRLRPTSAGFQQEADAQIKGALSGAQKLAATALGAATIGEGVKALAEAASAHQTAVALTEKTVENAGGAWKVYGETVEEALDKSARATGISFQDLYQGFIRLDTQIRDTPKALHALDLAEDVSRARHLQLGQAATALARAYAGNTQSLSRLGIVIPKVSAATDYLKGKLNDIKAAEEAQTEAGAKHYKGTIDLTDAQLALTKLSPVQLKNLTAQTNAQLATAAAQDKTASGAAALAEVQKRFGGEAATFANTAAGEYDKFRVSVEEAEASLGTALLPTLTEAAKAAAGYADQLGSSKGAADAVASGARDVGQGVQAAVAIIKAALPVFQALDSAVSAVGGVGPLVVAYTAYKTLGLGIGLAQKAVALFATDEAAAATAATAAATATAAQAAAVNGVTGAEERLALAQAAFVAASEDVAAVTTTYVGFGQVVFDDTVAVQGLTAAQGELAASLEAVAAAEAEVEAASGAAAAEAGGLGVALAGIGAPELVGIAAVAGGLYLLNSYLDKAGDQLADFRKEYAGLQADKDDSAAKAADVRKLVTSYVDLGHAQETAAGIAQGGAKSGSVVDATKLNTDATAKWIAKLHDLEGQLGNADPILKGQIDRLVNLAQATNRIPSKKTITLVLNDKSARDNLAADAGFIDQITKQAAGLGGELGKSLEDLGQPFGAFGRQRPPQKPLLDAKGFDAAIGAKPPVEKAAHQLGATAAQAFTTGFATTIDASTIATAFKDSVTQAQAALVSETSTLASTIGDALDARLKAQTLPATQEIARLQAQITASQARASVGDSAQAIADAQKKLADLQTVLGDGALTSDQQQALAQARLAVSDAQTSAANDAKQARITQLQAGVDAAGKANDAAKAASSKRLDDLSAELNDGLITQATYVKRLNAQLAKEGVNYKSTGKLLGLAVADGFRDGLASILAQAKALGGVNPSTLAKSSRAGAAAVDPAKAEADAIKEFIQSASQAGGKFNVTGAGNLPPGVTLAGLLAQASSERASSSYQQKSGAKADKALDYAGQTANHGALTVAELRKLNSRPIVVNVTVDGKKSKRKTAEATRS